MAARKDFLRHIVNRVLASSKLPRQVVDDIRRMVGRAEDKYKFHAFGGDVRNLAKYLRSRDFDDLVTLVRGIRVEKGEEQPLEVLKKILLEAREAYKDIPEVVAAIDERLKALEGEAESRRDRLEALYEELKKDLGGEVVVEYNPDKKLISISFGDKLSAEIGYNDETRSYVVSYRLHDTVSLETVNEVRNLLRRLLELVGGASRGRGQ
jgi:hypothetical protein